MPFFSYRIYDPVGGDITYYFVRIFTVEGERWFITFEDEPFWFSFYMKPENGIWVILTDERNPGWLGAIEHQISKVIMRYYTAMNKRAFNQSPDDDMGFC